MIWYRKFSLKTFLLLGDKIWLWRQMLQQFINCIISGIISGISYYIWSPNFRTISYNKTSYTRPNYSIQSDNRITCW